MRTLQKILKRVNIQSEQNGNPTIACLLINGSKFNCDSILHVIGGLVSGILVKVI